MVESLLIRLKETPPDSPDSQKASTEIHVSWSSRYVPWLEDMHVGVSDRLGRLAFHQSLHVLDGASVRRSGYHLPITDGPGLTVRSPPQASPIAARLPMHTDVYAGSRVSARLYDPKGSLQLRGVADFLPDPKSISQ